MEIHRDDQCGHGQRGKQGYRDAHSLVIEQGACHATEEYQRYKDRAGGQHRTQHRRKHFPGAFHNGCLQSHSLSPSAHHIVNHNDGVIYNHAHTQNQSRQRDDIHRDAQQVETEQGQYQ